MFFRRAMERRSAGREGVSLSDKKLLEMLGLDPDEVSVRGEKALKVDTVYACVKILSESVAKLPLKIYQEDEYGVQKAAQSYLYKLLKLRPNPYMSAADFWKCMEAQRCFGNAYAYIDVDKKTGRIKGLWPIDSRKITMWVDDEGVTENLIPGDFVGAKSRMWYQVDVGPNQIKLLPSEVLHFKGSITLDGLIGLNPMEYLKSTLENGAAATEFMNNFYRHGLQVKGIIQYVGDLDEKAKRNFRDKFEQMASGLKNSHRVALMPVGYQWIPMSLNMHDAQFLENHELTIRQIATAFGIKMHQLNDLSRATHTNVEQQEQQFYIDTLMPILTSYEQEMTYKLFTDQELDDGYYTKFNVDSILRADIEKRYRAYREGIQAGFIKPNEARQREELPPDPYGDELYANGNIIPLSMAGQQYTREELKGGEKTEEAEPEDGNQGDPGNPGDTGDPGSE